MDIRTDFIISSILENDQGIAYRSCHDCLKISASVSIFEVPNLLSKYSVVAGTVSSLLQKIYIRYPEISKSTEHFIDTEQLLTKLEVQSGRIEYVVIDCSRLGYSDCDKDEVVKHNNTQLRSVVNRYTRQKRYLNTIKIYTNVQSNINRFTQILLLHNSSLIQVVQKEKFDDDYTYRVFLNHLRTDDCKYEENCKSCVCITSKTTRTNRLIKLRSYTMSYISNAARGSSAASCMSTRSAFVSRPSTCHKISAACCSEHSMFSAVRIPFFAANRPESLFWETCRQKNTTSEKYNLRKIRWTPCLLRSQCCNLH